MEPRFLSEAGSGLSEEQSQLAATIANIAQAGVFLSFGPMVCLYGPAIFRVVTFIRSLFASNYMAFIGAVAAADTMTYFEVFVDRAVILIAGTVTMTIASLRSKKIRAYTAGAVLGTQIAIPLMSLLRQQLYFNSGFVGCTGCELARSTCANSAPPARSDCALKHTSSPLSPCLPCRRVFRSRHRSGHKDGDVPGW